MWALFDDSPGTIFASAAGLIVHFELLSAIPVVWAISEKDEKHSSVFVLAFPRGGGKMSAKPQSKALLQSLVSAHRTIICKAFTT